ncbi:glutathione peroxidase [Novosphingobium terrae]|uniref:glutathione peroxidase n=1 Tax=Novosphingobium terrae TaxID=2726189 RepID=UPI001980CACD|nr:glutathione peroxidase [Novosphingobium terrae]
MAQQRLSDFSARLPDGRAVSLSDKAGKVVLVVNTASQCGFTPQYAGLEKLWQDYGARGFEVLAFPCNQFGGQEPGSAEDIAQFCQMNFGLSFPVMDKVEVNGPGATPLWQWLTSTARGIFGTRKVKWNFTKFLVDREGRVVRRFGPRVKPEALKSAIEELL